MKVFLFLFILCYSLFVISVSANNVSRWVNTESGLRLRESPDLNAKVISIIPFGEEIILLEEKGETFSISDTSGKWSKVKWKDKEGWVFGGYLKDSNRKLPKLSIRDILGEWSYYFTNSGKPIKYFLLTNTSIVLYEPMRRESIWSFDDNTIYTEIKDSYGEIIIKAKWEILDYKKEYLKVRETWSSLDTTIRILELYKNAKERAIGDKPIKTLNGHTGFITSACFSPDGKYILSGASDMTVKLWDVTTGFEVKTLKGHNDRVTSVDISPDGAFAISVSENSVLIYWDLKEGRMLNKTVLNYDPQNPKSNPIYSACFSPDGKTVLLGYKSGSVSTVDLATGERVNIFFGHESEITSVSYSPNGKYVLTGSFDKTVRLWDAQNAKLIHTVQFGYSTDYDKLVYSVCFSNDSNYALCGLGDGTMILLEVETGKWVRKFFGHKKNTSINSVCFTSDGNYFISGSDDTTVILWNIIDGKVEKTFYPDDGDVCAVDISPDGKYALSAQGKTIKLWDISILNN